MSDGLEGLDDLLNDGPSMSLASEELLAAGEGICQTIWDAGCEAWGVLLNRGVMYTAGNSDYNTATDLLPADLGECVVTTVEWSGDREGTFHIVLPTIGAKTVVAFMMALMMGTDANPDEQALDEEGLDAYSEAINQFVGSSAQALRNDPGGNVTLTVKETKLATIGEAEAEKIFGSELFFCSMGQLTIEGASPCNVMTLLMGDLTGVKSEIPEKPEEFEVAGTVPAGESGGGSGGLDISRAMHIKLPVQVSLAEKQERLNNIMHLVPGSIIEFRKSAEELLELRVGNITIARGEAVIVEEHFGLQIRRMANVQKELARMRDD